MQRLSVYFTAPREVTVREERMPELLPDQVRVQTLYSGISPGTERLIYHGQFPEDLFIDENIAALSGRFTYPLRYGYTAIGRVVSTGPDVKTDWIDQLVFAFQPHTSHFNAPVEELIPIPEDISPELAIFLPNMETAVNFLMDGRPMIGEQVLVSGQGIVGLLTTALLARFPLGSLVTLDRYSLRRQASLELGAHASLDSESTESRTEIERWMPNGADLAYELSGAPQALDELISLTGFDGRVLIGSWYGQKRASLDLGGRFHRSRIRLISSQVSTLAPEFLGRWNKSRRFEVVWDMLRVVHPERFITHRIPLTEAPKAYQLLDDCPEQSIQIVFTYTK